MLEKTLSLALILGILGVDGLAASRDYKTDFEFHRKILEGIPQQVRIEHTLYLEQLAEGERIGLWGPAVRERAREMIEGVLSWTHIPSGRGFVLPSDPLDSLLGELEGTLFAFPWKKQFMDQLRMISFTREEAIAAFAALACEFAEEAWVKAHKPGDLEQAAQWLRQAMEQALANNWQRMGDQLRPGPEKRLKPSFDILRLEELTSAFDLLAASEPFYLPDPEDAIDQYVWIQIEWEATRQFGNRFVRRPAIAAHYAAAMESVFQERNRRMDRVNQGIREAWSADRYSAALDDLLAAGPPEQATAPPSMMERLKTVPNRRDPLNKMDFKKPRKAPPIVPPGVLRAYRWWQDFATKRDAGIIAGPTEARSQILGKLSGLGNKFASEIADGLDPKFPAKPPVVLQPALPPKDTISALEMTLLERATDHPKGLLRKEAVREMMQRWRDCAAQGHLKVTRAEGFGVKPWQLLFLMPGGTELVVLRDRATRELITAADREAAAQAMPVTVLLEERLSAALAKGNHVEGQRLVTISSLSGLLAEPQHDAYAEAFRAVERAESAVAAGNSGQGQGIYRGLLEEVLLPEAGVLAARRYRELSPSK